MFYVFALYKCTFTYLLTCLDTDNFTDQLLSVEKQIRDLKASIKASVASYKLQRQTSSVVMDAVPTDFDAHDNSDEGTLLHVVDRHVSNVTVC